MRKAASIPFAVLTLSALLLGGCGKNSGSSEKTDKYDSYIKLKAEDAGLIDHCTEIAESRLLSYYPQIESDADHDEEGTLIISFDCPEDWDDAAIDKICRCGRLTFRKGTDTGTDTGGNTVPTGEIVLDNSDVSKAEAAMVETIDGLEYSVTISMNGSGRDKFAAATQELAGTDMPLSIWFDDELISAPTVAAPITDGQAVITGNFSKDSAEELANAIDSGAMPCGLTVIEKKINKPHDDGKNK